MAFIMVRVWRYTSDIPAVPLAERVEPKVQWSVGTEYSLWDRPRGLRNEIRDTITVSRKKPVYADS